MGSKKPCGLGNSDAKTKQDINKNKPENNQNPAVNKGMDKLRLRKSDLIVKKEVVINKEMQLAR